MRRSILIAAVLFCFAASALAQDKVTFGRKYEPGTYLTTIKEKSDTQIGGHKVGKNISDLTVTTEMIIDKATAKEQKLHLTFRRYQLKITGSQERSYDSAKADENNKSTENEGLKEIVDRKFDITLDDKGTVTKVDGDEENESDDEVKYSLGLDNCHLPDKAVAVGDHWDATVKQKLPVAGTKDVKSTNTLRKIEKVGERQVAVIEVEGDMVPADKGEKTGTEADAGGVTIKVHLKGTVKVDVASGRPLESRIVMDIDMSVTYKARGKEKPVIDTIKKKSTMEIATREGKYEAPKTTPKE